MIKTYLGPYFLYLLGNSGVKATLGSAKLLVLPILKNLRKWTVEDQFWTQSDAQRSWIGIVQRENMVNEALQEYVFVSPTLQGSFRDTQVFAASYTGIDLGFTSTAFSGPCLKNRRQFVK